MGEIQSAIFAGQRDKAEEIDADFDEISPFFSRYFSINANPRQLVYPRDDPAEKDERFVETHLLSLEIVQVEIRRINTKLREKLNQQANDKDRLNLNEIEIAPKVIELATVDNNSALKIVPGRFEAAELSLTKFEAAIDGESRKLTYDAEVTLSPHNDFGVPDSGVLDPDGLFATAVADLEELEFDSFRSFVLAHGERHSEGLMNLLQHYGLARPYNMRFDVTQSIQGRQHTELPGSRNRTTRDHFTGCRLL